MTKENDKEQQELQAAIVEELMTARAFAKTVFEVDPSPEVVATMATILEVADADEELAGDIKTAREHAGAIFETKAPTPEMVLTVFHKLFIEGTVEDRLEELEEKVSKRR